MAAVVLYLTCSIAAWWFYPGSFTPRHNWLSDLGDPRRNPAGAFFYNAGCGLTALALLVFVVGLSRWRRGRPRGHGWVAAAQVVGTVSAAALLMVGVFSTDRLRQHLMYSNWFFASFPVFIALRISAEMPMRSPTVPSGPRAGNSPLASAAPPCTLIIPRITAGTGGIGGLVRFDLITG